MAIPISKYIEATSVANAGAIVGRDFSGLVFSKVAMKTGAPKKTDYETNKNVVSLSRDEISENFDNAGLIAFADKYFSYTGGTRRPQKLSFAYVGSTETAKAAFDRVTQDFVNFGAFAFYGEFELDDEEEGGILDVAIANNGNEYGWVLVVETNSTNQAADSAALSGQRLTHLTHTAVEPLAWYASCDYSSRGSAGTIDYKQFVGSTATVDTASGKDVADGLKVNYIGLVQNYGDGLKFYQKGVNMDGSDLGVVRDSCWINHEIASGYFSLQTSVPKIPANHTGCAMIRNIIVGVASRAIECGAILIDKPLGDEQKAEIVQYTGNDDAVSEVQTNGYYIDVKIVKDRNSYKAQYTLVYAKGDHISKVNGVHVLV